MAWIRVLETTEPTPEEAEAALLGACRAGDRAALRRFYDQNVGDVMRAARRLGLSRTDVEDVTQEVFATAFRDIAKVRPGALSGWLFRLVSNRVNDRHRRSRVRAAFARLFSTHPELRAETGPETNLMQADAERRVARILQRLSQKRRDVFVLSEIEGFSGEEIAQRLGIRVEAVWTRLHHARKDFGRIGRSLQLIDEAEAPKDQQ